MTIDYKTTWISKVLFFVLCALIILTTLAYGTVHQPVIIIYYVFVVLVMLLWAADGFASGTLRFNKSLIQLPLIALFVYCFFQLIPFGTLGEQAGVSGIPRTISQEPFWTKVTALHLFSFISLLAALLTYVDSLARLKKIVMIITAFGFVYAFFAILQSVLSPNKIYGIYEVPYATPFGSFVNRHNFAAYMEMTISVPLGLLFVGAIQKDRRLLYITAVGLMGVALLLSGSRGGLFSLIAAVFFLIISTTKTKSSGQLILKFGLAVLLLGTIVTGAILIGGESSLTRLAETAGSEDFSANRFQIWSVSLDIIKHNWLLGAGIGAFAVAYNQFDTLNGVARVEQAHNDYLQLFADAGIVGLLIGGFFVYLLFRIGFQNNRSASAFKRGVSAGALAGCFAILVHSLFDFVLHTTSITLLFITLVSLVVVSGSSFPDDDSEDEAPRSRKKKRPATVQTAAENVALFEEKRRKIQR